MEPTLHYLTVPGPRAIHGNARRLAWWEWNATGVPYPDHVVVCVHGLTRQARDFDELARALAPGAAVVCADVAGRGHSDWLQDPMAYQIPTYVNDLALLLAHLRQRHAQASGAADPYALRIDWVGTSMGGLIGMALASQPATGVRRLVLNDIGPVIEPVALERIAQYVGEQPVFASEQAAADALWQTSSAFGPHTPEQWLALTRPMLRPVPGGWTLHYDPAIAVPLRALLDAQRAAQATDASTAAHVQAAVQQASAASMWAMYDAISCPTLLLRGAESDLLLRATAIAMTQRGPRARLVEFPGVGHAPTLVQPEQIRVVVDFLLTP